MHHPALCSGDERRKRRSRLSPPRLHGLHAAWWRERDSAVCVGEWHMLRAPPLWWLDHILKSSVTYVVCEWDWEWLLPHPRLRAVYTVS